MPQTAIPDVERFIGAENNVTLFLPLIANFSKRPKDVTYGVPTAAELGAGKILTGAIAGREGWTVETAFISTPTLDSRFAGNHPGAITSPDSALTFYADLDGDDVRKVLPRDTRGYILIAEGGDEVGKLADIFPVTVGSVSPVYTDDGRSDVHKLRVQFSIDKQPAQAIPLVAPTS